MVLFASSMQYTLFIHQNIIYQINNLFIFVKTGTTWAGLKKKEGKAWFSTKREIQPTAKFFNVVYGPFF